MTKRDVGWCIAVTIYQIPNILNSFVAAPSGAAVFIVGIIDFLRLGKV